MFVPVVDSTQKPLMPTKPSRARRWIQQGKATPFWKNGVFCVRLNVDPSDVMHVKYGLARISGFRETGISLYSLEGKRLC